jgi:ubiquinone/menaquinone biosynthesis C-methylase UbiE
MWRYDDFRRLRLAEVTQVARTLADLGFPRGSVLEIGAGSGWQAKYLADRGYDVRAIDIAGSVYSASREFAVQEYDGKHIPFPNESFDIVFSSNVLEHIAWIEEFQREIQRVLKPGGVSVHLVPSSCWRLWTTVFHPVFVIQYTVPVLVRKIRNRFVKQADAAPRSEWAYRRSSSRLNLMRSVIFTRRHGEFGNCITEQYYFSRYRWNALFARAGWERIRRFGNKLAYTGHGILGGKVPLSTRRSLSGVFGSSCHLYVMQKRASALKSENLSIREQLAN